MARNTLIPCACKQQDDVSHLVMQLTGKDQPLYELTPEEEADIAASDAAAARGEFATEEQIRAILSKHGL
jgi:predicted transcriptional regulator